MCVQQWQVGIVLTCSVFGSISHISGATYVERGGLHENLLAEGPALITPQSSHLQAAPVSTHGIAGR